MTVPYRSTPVFDENTLPAALRSRHSTRADVWGMVRVLEGRVRLTYLEPASEMLLDPATAGPLLPGQPHRRHEAAGRFLQRAAERLGAARPSPPYR